MGSVRRRLEVVEARIGARASPGERPHWRTPAEERERTRQFRKLYQELGIPWPPKPKSREELFEAVEVQRRNLQKGER